MALFALLACVIVWPVEGATLRPLLYDSLPLGKLQPSGWLKQELVVQANGLSGHLSLFWADVNQSVWVGGKADQQGAGHERLPYWLNGVVPLAAQLRGSEELLDVDLDGQVDRIVAYIVAHQQPDGWLGPDDGFGGKGNTYWTGWDVALAFQQYAQSRPEKASNMSAVVLRYIKEVHRRMLTTPTASWSQNRWQDWAWLCQNMLDQFPDSGQEQMLWDAMTLAQQQGFDWDGYYLQTGSKQGNHSFPESGVPKWTMWDHGVNNGMALKGGAVWYRVSGHDADRMQSYLRRHMQMRYHGQPYGLYAADECFAGRGLNHGTELCTVVEVMASLEHIFKVQGDTFFLDALERIAFNALPGEITADMWAHQYLQQANAIDAGHTDPHVWMTDGPDSTIFGLAPNFGCCTGNFNQGWPKFAQNALLYSTRDQGVVVSQYVPCVGYFAEGVTVSIHTTYPFGDNATMHVTSTDRRNVTLHLRIPSWATRATVSLNGGPPQAAANGTLYTVAVPTGQGKGSAAVGVVVVAFHPEIRVEPGWGTTNAAAVLRGPLLYSLHLEEVLHTIRNYTFQSRDYNITTPTRWNVALVLDATNPASSLTFHRTSDAPNKDLPFTVHQHPVTVRGKARVLTKWVDVHKAAPDPPQSPVECTDVDCGPQVDVELVPYGATDLRMAAMPFVHS